METEPISVRVARLRGCEPVHVDADDQRTVEHWRCACKIGHGYSKAEALLSAGDFGAWIQQGATWLLLSEMTADGWWLRVSEDGVQLYGPVDSRVRWVSFEGVPLEEAVALAWCAWRESQR